MRSLYMIVLLLQLLSTTHGITHSQLKLHAEKIIAEYTHKTIKRSIAGYLSSKCGGKDPQELAEAAVRGNGVKGYKTDRSERTGLGSDEKYLLRITLDTLKRDGDKGLDIEDFTKWIQDGLKSCIKLWEDYQIDRAGVGINLVPAFADPLTVIKTKSVLARGFTPEPEIDWDWNNIRSINTTICLNIFRNGVILEALPTAEQPVKSRKRVVTASGPEQHGTQDLLPKGPVSESTTALQPVPQANVRSSRGHDSIPPERTTRSDATSEREIVNSDKLLSPQISTGSSGADIVSADLTTTSQNGAKGLLVDNLGVSPSVGEGRPQPPVEEAEKSLKETEVNDDESPTEREPGTSIGRPTERTFPVVPTTTGDLSNFPPPTATAVSDPPLSLGDSQVTRRRNADGVTAEETVPTVAEPQGIVSSHERVLTASGSVPDQDGIPKSTNGLVSKGTPALHPEPQANLPSSSGDNSIPQERTIPSDPAPKKEMIDSDNLVSAPITTDSTGADTVSEDVSTTSENGATVLLAENLVSRPVGRPAEETEQSDEGWPVEKTEESDKGRPVENTKESDKGRPLEKTEESDKGRPVENIEESDKGRPVEKTEESDEGKPVEKTEESDKGRPVEKTEESDEGKPVEKTEESDEGNPVEETEESVGECREPTEKTEESVGDRPDPVRPTEKSVEGSPQPVHENEKSVEGSPEPVHENKKSVEEPKSRKRESEDDSQTERLPVKLASHQKPFETNNMDETSQDKGRSENEECKEVHQELAAEHSNPTDFGPNEALNQNNSNEMREENSLSDEICDKDEGESQNRGESKGIVQEPPYSEPEPSTKLSKNAEGDPLSVPNEGERKNREEMVTESDNKTESVVEETRVNRKDNEAVITRNPNETPLAERDGNVESDTGSVVVSTDPKDVKTASPKQSPAEPNDDVPVQPVDYQPALLPTAPGTPTVESGTPVVTEPTPPTPVTLRQTQLGDLATSEENKLPSSSPEPTTTKLKPVRRPIPKGGESVPSRGAGNGTPAGAANKTGPIAPPVPSDRTDTNPNSDGPKIAPRPTPPPGINSVANGVTKNMSGDVLPKKLAFGTPQLKEAGPGSQLQRQTFTRTVMKPRETGGVPKPELAASNTQSVSTRASAEQESSSELKPQPTALPAPAPKEEIKTPESSSSTREEWIDPDANATKQEVVDALMVARDTMNPPVGVGGMGKNKVVKLLYRTSYDAYKLAAEEMKRVCSKDENENTINANPNVASFTINATTRRTFKREMITQFTTLYNAKDGRRKTFFHRLTENAAVSIAQANKPGQWRVVVVVV